MGMIMSIYKIYPEEIDDLNKIMDSLKTEIKEPFKLQGAKEEPIGFGLSLIRIGITFPDKTDGLLDKLEGILRAIPGVRELEIEGSTLVS